jgi:hypothetical protein
LQNPLATPAHAGFGAQSAKSKIVAKKSKTEPEKKVTDMGEANSAATNGSSATAPKKKSRSAQVKPKAKKPAAKKTAAPASRGASKKAASSPALREPTDEEIRIRAYFLAERRIQLSQPGDSAHDWIEARRQLIEEAGR